MAVFSYAGRNQNGDEVSGALDAASAEVAAHQLLAGGIYPTAIKQNKAESDEEGISFSIGRKVKADELIILTRQLYSLTKAGVPLNKSMHGLATTLKNNYLVKVLRDVEKNLNSGVTLSSAMSRHVEVFPRLYVSMVMVGENSGRLDEAFKELIDHLELEQETARRIGGAFRYPMFVFIALCIAIVILNLFVIPVFADLFTQFGAELPLMTKILLATSNFFINYWGLLLVISMGSLAAFLSWINKDKGRIKWDAFKLRIPLVGSIILRAVLARFCRTFAMMMSAGVPLLQGVELCSTTVGNAAIGERIKGMRKGIERGESLLQAIGNSEMFTPLVMQMVAVGEQTGQVDEMLNEVADFYNREVDYEIKNLSANMEPILIVMMAILVGILALGIFLPMWDMFGVVQG
ncbi:MAG: type II secretion system F family protein [Gammaproteobacteria bacterium]|nr:type II secretion system F family protein [Gammaproteobacteria bacterium]NND39978.1 type II secretion system F family protein [Pseudomonadales bacterium]MBT8151406.1 type II secretion system F family protein [Gammaproteobacteria bacterium]NNL10213.1 type II secretion system F family protein [Pseudomonadales bacterium]NNM10993.1 type II secretion system F family protein [Pseudomonadales bacterium]